MLEPLAFRGVKMHSTHETNKIFYREVTRGQDPATLST